MDDSANLTLPYIMPAQAQKHVTHNEALARLDSIVQLAVRDRDLAAPPAEPADGDRYIVAADATGAWEGWAASVAAWHDGAWQRLVPRAGWVAFVLDEAAIAYFDGAAWQALSAEMIGAQPADGDLAAIAALTTTDFGRALLTQASAATARAVLGLETAADIPVVAGSGIAAEDVQAALEELDAGKAPLVSPALSGVPTAPTAVSGTSSAQIATTAFVQAAVATGGGAVTAAGVSVEATGGISADNVQDALEALAASLGGVLEGAQPLDSDLTAIAALATTSFGRGLLELADAGALREAAGLQVGVDVQAQSANLVDFAAKAAPAGDVVGTTDVQTLSSKALQTVSRFGLDTTADATNPFSATLNKALWSAKYAADGGDGDLRYTLNKESAGDLASYLFQTDFSARAEFGLIGNDDFTAKVSPDGSTWHEGYVIDKDDGTIRFPSGIVHAPSGAPVRNLVFLPASGDGVSSVWRCNVAERSATPRTATIASVAGDTITIGSSDAFTFGVFQDAGVDFMLDCSYVRIWNASKDPEEAAWVKHTPATNQVQVTAAGAIAGWSSGDTIRLGEPGSVAPVAGMFAIDISPMLLAQFGVVFRQAGLLVKMLAVSASEGVSTLSVSEAGLSGSLLPVRSFPDGTQQDEQFIVPCSVQSPISNSNLLFIREQGPIRVGAVSILGVYI